jgi:transcriptional regulator with XRE-family HTH domain
MTRSTHNPAYVVFLSLLRSERKAKGVSQVQLAETLGNRQTFISKIENGERRLDVVELLEYLEGVGADASDFVTRLKARLRTGGRKDRKLAARKLVSRKR